MVDDGTGSFAVGVIQTPAGGFSAGAVRAFGSRVAPHDLLVLPEMANTPYFPLDGVDAVHRPRSTDHPLATTLKPYQELAHRTRSYVAIGLCLTDGHRVRNAAVVLDRDGGLVDGSVGAPGGWRSAVRITVASSAVRLSGRAATIARATRRD